MAETIMAGNVRDFGELIFRGFKKHIKLELLSRKLPGTHMQCDSSDIYQIRFKTFDKHQNVQTFL